MCFVKLSVCLLTVTAAKLLLCSVVYLGTWTTSEKEFTCVENRNCKIAPGVLGKFTFNVDYLWLERAVM